MAFFWDVAPRSMAEVYRRFRGVNCLHLQGYRPHGTSVNICQTTQHIPEDTHLHARLIREAPIRVHDIVFELIINSFMCFDISVNYGQSTPIVDNSVTVLKVGYRFFLAMPFGQ
jgi:hypothetical protein